MKNKNRISRRKFIAAGVAATATTISGFPFVRTGAQSVKPLKIGVVGCGGRGTGAADNAIEASKDIHLIALADPFKDRVERSLKALTNPKRRGGPLPGVEVKEDHIFTGMDCHDKLLETDIDYVILAGPPGTRPLHFEAAVNAGKHVFMEKPVGTDPVGIRKILKTAKKAKEKKLSVVVGFDNRHSLSTREIVKNIHDGWIGDVVAGQSYYNTGTLWHRGEDPSWSEMEYQCRNWYYYCWLSGDHIVEQHVHGIDVCNWVMGGYPVKALAVGGRQVRTETKWGNIYDHFTVDYEYANGAHIMSMCRQLANCDVKRGNLFDGTKGRSSVGFVIGNVGGTISGARKFESVKDEVTPKVYEHWELSESIRKGKPRSEAENGAYSTLTAIMGREAAYTGKVITWEDILNSDLNLFPKKFELGHAPKRPVAMPGQSRPK